MSKTVRFEASHTNTVNASASDIWAIWTDVSKWTALDAGNGKASLRGSFAPGSVVSLTLRNGSTFEVHLKTVTKNEEFSYETAVPGGVVRTYHKMKQSGDHLIVTYALEAEITEKEAHAFSIGLWQNLVAGIPSQVENVTALARAA